MDYNEQLTRNIKLSEMVYSKKAIEKDIVNIPDDNSLINLKALAVNVLQPIRDYFGSPLVISSGFRSPKLNKLVGGSITSDHLTGRACDFTVQGFSVETVFKAIIQLNRQGKLPFKQLINEYGKWIHISYDDLNNKADILVATKNGYKKYEEKI